MGRKELYSYEYPDDHLCIKAKLIFGTSKVILKGRDLRASWTKVIPQRMLQIQPTMTRKVTIWSRADSRLRPKACNGFSIRVLPQQKTVNDENNVPERQRAQFGLFPYEDHFRS